MSAIHTLQSQVQMLQTQKDQLSNQMLSQQAVMSREINSLRSALGAQEKVNNQLSQQITIQQKKAEASVQQLQSSFKQTEEKLQKKYQEQSVAFNQRLKEQKANFEREIANQANNFQQALQHQQNDFQQKLNYEATQRKQALDALNTSMQQQIASVREDYTRITEKQQKQIDAVKADVGRLIDNNQQSQQQAIEMIEDLQIIVNAIQNNNGRVALSDYQKFAPNRLFIEAGRIQGAVNQATINPQASIALSQAVMYALTDLEFEVVSKKEQFDNEYAMTILAYEYLTHHIQLNEFLPIRDESQKQEYRLNDWTNGRYDAFKAKVKADYDNIMNNYDSLSLRDLEQFQQRNTQYKDEFKEIIQEGVNRVISSQQRYEMAKKIAEVLESFNFDATVAGYENADKKQSYMVGTLRSADDTKITVAVIPNDDTFENTIVINTDEPGFLRVAEADARTNAIIKVLNNAGVVVGGKQALDTHSDNLMDVYRITQPNGGGIPQVTKAAVGNLSQGKPVVNVP